MKKIFLGILIVFFLSISSFGISSAGLHNFGNNNDSRDINDYTLPPAEKTVELSDQNTLISTNDVWIPSDTALGRDNEKFYFTFEPPEIIVDNDFSHLLVPECYYFNPGGAPMLPKRVLTITLPPGTIVNEVKFYPETIFKDYLSAPVQPAYTPYPVIKGVTENIKTEPEMDLEIYNLNEFYPQNFLEYSTGFGLNPQNNERELFLVIHVFPIQYNPVKNEITYITSGELEVQFDAPEVQARSRARSSSSSRETTHDMVIICPNNYDTSELRTFAERKTSTGVDSIVVTLTDITSGTYFPLEGRDTQEKIKYFIFNAVKNWDIKYVLIAGDDEEIPTRITHVDEPGLNDNEASDLYYADVMDSNNRFCTWDYDGDDRFGEYSGSNIDKADLYPDVHIGRFPVSNTGQLNTLIDKTINYEYTAIGQEWFKNAVLCGMDTFGGGAAEGEYLSDYIASHYLQDFNVIKLYETDGTLSTQAVKTNTNLGAGFTSFSDHGLHSAWGGSVFTSSDVRSLTNGNKLPFVNYDACLTGEFDTDNNDCLAEETILNPNGGGVAVVASSRIAYGSWGQSHINSVSGYLNVRLYHNYDRTTEVAGELLSYAKIDYLRNVGSGGPANFKTVVEYNYFGDPSLLIGGLPTAIFNIKCDDNTSIVKPGESIDYVVQVENTDIQSRQISVSTINVPPNWETKLSEKTLYLNSNQKTEVTITITAPPDAIAGFVARIKVEAKLANIERTLCIGTKTTVDRIYGLNILPNKYGNTSGSVNPNREINFTFQVKNFGNAEDKVLLDMELKDSPFFIWDYVFSESTVTISPFSKQEVSVRIIIPQTAVAKDYNLSVKGKLLSNSEVKRLDLVLTVQRVYGVNLSCSESDERTDPGTNVTFNTVLINKGNHLEAFLLTIPNLPLDWSVKFKTTNTTNETLFADAFTELPVATIIHVPKGTLVGVYNLTLMAQCVDTQFVIKSSLDLNVVVNRVYGILLTTPLTELASDPGEDTFFYIELNNLGNDMDSATIHVITQPDDWEIILDSRYDILLAPNGKRNIGLRITPYEQALVGTYDINLRATLEGDNSISDLRLKYTINRVYNLSFSTVNSPVEVTSGSSNNIPIRVINQGNEKDIVTISIDSQIPNCSVSIRDSEPLTLKAYGSKDVELIILADESIFAGEKSIPIIGTLKSNGENYTYDFKFNIKQYCGVELEAAKKHINSQPGDEIKFEVFIKNTGNGEDTYDFIIEGIPSSWHINFPTKHAVTIKPFGYSNKTLYLNIPSEEPYHDVNLDIRVKSTIDNQTIDRLQLTTSIQEDKTLILGMSVETFALDLIIIIIFLILIVVAVIKHKTKKDEEKRQKTNVIEYSLGSDGSRVQWEEPTQVLPVQYNPPTPIAAAQPFDIQIQQPETYRGLTKFSSTSQAKFQSQTYPTQNLEPLSYTDALMLPPYDADLGYDQDELAYNPPEDSQPVPTVVTPMPTLADEQFYSEEVESQVLDQLDAELTAETLAIQEAETKQIQALATEEFSEYHEGDQFSLDFKHPENDNKTQNPSNINNTVNTAVSSETPHDLNQEKPKIFDLKDGITWKKPKHSK